MADKHPYVTGTGGLVKSLNQFRSSLPGKIDASLLKKLGIAPKNESYLINVLKFLNAIDDDGIPTPETRSIFSQHDDATFAKKLSDMVKKAYSDLFSVHGDQAWGLDTEALVTYFRHTDQTSAVVGKKQASTFLTLAAFSGHGEVPSARQSTSKKKSGKSNTIEKTDKERNTETKVVSTDDPKRRKDLGLTVRVEINLPADGDQETYDRIFKSIKENLLDG